MASGKINKSKTEKIKEKIEKGFCLGSAYAAYATLKSSTAIQPP
jgi:hypothetical protein